MGCPASGKNRQVLIPKIRTGAGRRSSRRLCQTFSASCFFVPQPRLSILNVFCVCLMNVLFVHPNYPAQFRHIARVLAQKKHRVLFITANGRKAFFGFGKE